MAQEQVSKAKAKTEEVETETVEAKSEVDDKLDQDVADILADIDDVLGTEEEAQAMVAGFVQQGGE